MVHAGLIFAVNGKGDYSVLEAATGKIVVEKELSLPAAEKSTRVANFYPSLALAGTLLFVGDDGGGSLWLRPGRAYAERAGISCPSAVGTPTFAGGRLFLRGGRNLYCISAK